MSAQLYETPGNPIPANASVATMTMADGKRVRYARFAAEGRPLRGTVIIFPGRNECIEKYFETISDLSARGFGVTMFDWRGQGGSDRLIRNTRRGFVESFDDYAADVEPFFEHVVLPDCRAPFYVLAHSAGALVALLAAPKLYNRVRRMVLSTPLLTLTGLPISEVAAWRLVSTMHAVGLGKLPFGRGAAPFETNVLTSDPVRYARNQEIYRLHPELATGSPTATWLRAVFMAAEKVRRPEFLGRLQVPMLLVAAGADRVVSTQAIERFSRRLKGGRLVTIDGARHELLQEADRYREQFFAAFDAFIPGSVEAAT